MVAIETLPDCRPAPGRLKRLAWCCRLALADRRPAPPPAPAGRSPGRLLQALCLSALALPGLSPQAYADGGVQPPADSDEEAGFQYSHYEEEKRPIYQGTAQVKNNYQPISVDGQHLYVRFRPLDRVRFNYNFSEDVWAGATPWFTTPVTRGDIYTGASYWLKAQQSNILFDSHGNPLNYNQSLLNHMNMNVSPNLGVQQALSYASPEVRDQSDFRIGYDWDNAALDIGGGVSQERDYLSRFGNLGLRMDFDQKQTTVNMGLSYTNSDTKARWNLDNWTTILPADEKHCSDNAYLCGNRQDGTVSLALSRVISKDSVWSAGFSYMVSSGYLANPYKAVLSFSLDPNWRQENGLDANAYPGILAGQTGGLAGGLIAEQRPTLRNQFTWDTHYLHYVSPLDAAVDFKYSFFHDDWGISAHTFDGEWRQEVLDTWMLKPHIRYYSQTAADFYVPYLFTSDPNNPGNYGPNGMFSNAALVNRYFSSDQRLGGYGALSGGIAISKQFARGMSLEMGYEYYTHQNALTLGGGGTGSYTDFNYFVANAALRINVGQLAGSRKLADGYGVGDWLGSLFDDGETAAAAHAAGQHGLHAGAAPAGVMFAHMLDRAGQFMTGYRFMQTTYGPDYLQGPSNVPRPILNPTQSPGVYMYATHMVMNMHMLEFMYAPTDWMNLMLMPQYLDNSMDMKYDVSMGKMMQLAGGMTMPPMRQMQQNGGFGDTSAYAMFRLWDDGVHRLHLTQGISVPTGSVNTRNEFFEENTKYYYPYNMQLGSGTWDYKPSATYSGMYADWFWGGQVSGTHRLQQQNSYGWRLGDIFQATAWTGYQFLPWLGGTVRGVYTGQGKMAGKWNSYYSKHPAMPMPEDSPQNYGGSLVDLGLGITAAVPGGKLAGNSFSFEWLQPMYTDYQGYQLERNGTFNATWHYQF